MKYFLDAEFYEDGMIIDLLSIALVADDGREYYAEPREANRVRAAAAGDNFLRMNVLPKLHVCIYQTTGPEVCSIPNCPVKPRAQIRDELLLFLASYPPSSGDYAALLPEFWGWYPASDWVAFYQLFGRMVDLPKSWSRRCNDLKQWMNTLGNPSFPRTDASYVHHALGDARWLREVWHYLDGVQAAQSAAQSAALARQLDSLPTQTQDLGLPMSLVNTFTAQRRLVASRGDKSMEELLAAVQRVEAQGQARQSPVLSQFEKRGQGMLLTEQAMGLVREVGEFLNEFPHTKRWTGGVHPGMTAAQREAAADELVDVYIFWVNLALIAGYSEEEVSEAWERKVAKNERRARNVVNGLGWVDGVVKRDDR